MSLALVIGASGGIGAAIVSHLEASGRYRHVIGLSRSSDPALDLLDDRPSPQRRSLSRRRERPVS